MTLADPRYTFRPVTRDDLPLLRRWLETPEARRWWGDADEEFALMEEDLDDARMAQWIVALEGRPFAYAQAYEVHAWPQPHLAALPQGALAIDAFIGEPDLLERGHGGRFLRRLAEQLLAEGAAQVVIDPDADNARAIAAYRRAGFKEHARPQAEAGAVVVMAFSP